MNTAFMQLVQNATANLRSHEYTENVAAAVSGCFSVTGNCIRCP